MSWKDFKLSEVRQQYIGNLETAISYMHNLLDSEYRKNDNLKDSIYNVAFDIDKLSDNNVCCCKWGDYDEDEHQLFDSLNMFLNVGYEPGNYNNLLLTKQEEFIVKGKKYMNKLLLKSPVNINCSVCHRIDLSDLDCNTLPFILTRSIYNSELELWEGLMEYYNVLEHNSRLSSRLSKLQDNLMELKDDIRDELKGKMCNIKDDLSMKEIKDYGFPKTKIISQIRKYLNKVMDVYGKDEKIKIIRNLFKYMENDYVKEFINSHNKFDLTVKRKLEELCYRENLKEARVWYRNIYGKRIPIVEDTKYCENDINFELDIDIKID